MSNNPNALYPIGTIVKFIYRDGVYGVVIGGNNIFNTVKWFGDSHNQEDGSYLSLLLKPLGELHVNQVK